MSTFLSCIIVGWCLGCTSALGATADELAREVIHGESAGAHNPSNDSTEELRRAAAANSRLRLRWLMLNDPSVSEEIRICYAIRVIDDKLGLHKILRSGSEHTPEEEDLLEKRLLLGKRLIEIDQAKAEQAVVRDPPPASSPAKPSD